MQKEKLFGKNQFEINIRGYIRGLYIVRLYNQTDDMSKKFLIY